MLNYRIQDSRKIQDEAAESNFYAAQLIDQWQSKAQMGRKNDPPGTPAIPYNHGPRGLFNDRSTDNRVFSALMLPLGGVADSLPVYNGGRVVDDEYGGVDLAYTTILTGVTSGAADSFSNQPTTACADGPVGGLRKLCSIVNVYGNYKVSTREVEIDRAGRLADRCDDVTLQLMNMPTMSPILGRPTTTPSLTNALANELAARIFESMVSFVRMFAPRVWTGSPTNNSGERKDILGLETQINTGTHVDALSSSICTAADPDVKAFGFSLVTGSGRDIIEYLEMADNYAHWNARKQGATIDDGFFAMRPELFLVLSEVLPIRQFQAALRQMALFSGGQANVDARDMQSERNRIRNQMTIPINGRMVTVIEDDTLPEQNVTTTGNLLAGQYASDIYYIPTVVNGIPVTYWDVWNHDNVQSRAIQNWMGPNVGFTSDGGRFRWDVNAKNGCLKLNVRVKPRLMLHTPQFCTRITNVAYQPLQHLRSWDPASNYFFDGGRLEGSAQLFYAPWSVETPVTLS
jgi:hypothetical protein